LIPECSPEDPGGFASGGDPGDTGGFGAAKLLVVAAQNRLV
jgi:hypothetical protein